KFRQEIVVGQEETFDRTVEDHHLHPRIAFKVIDDLFELRNGFRPEDIQGRIVKSHAPAGRRGTFKLNPSGFHYVALLTGLSRGVEDARVNSMECYRCFPPTTSCAFR